MPPAELAEMVCEAVYDDRLYTLTHPDRKPHFEWRPTNILAERNPDVMALLKGLS